MSITLQVYLLVYTVLHLSKFTCASAIYQAC